MKSRVVIFSLICVLILVCSVWGAKLKSKLLYSYGKFAFDPTPQNAQAGGISGIFYHESPQDETCVQNYNVLRFYDDGLVIDVPICEDGTAGETFTALWPNISTWFHRANNDAGGKGTYYIGNNKIWFRTIEEHGIYAVTDYSGTFSNDRLVLDIFSHYNRHRTIQIEFIRLNVSVDQ